MSERHATSPVLATLGAIAWRWRTEILVATGLLCCWSWLGAQVGDSLGGALLALAAALVVAVGPIRRFVIRLFRRARARRRFEWALRTAADPVLREWPPRVTKVRTVASGERLEVQMVPGTWSGQLEADAGLLAAALRVRKVRVTSDPQDAGHVTVTVERKDPFGSSPTTWPGREIERTSLWDPIPVGIDENGEQVSMVLPEHNLLLGGEPGAGKSVALSLLVGWAALDPMVKLWLLDGKLVELAPWAGCAERTVGTNISEAVAVLQQLRIEMDLRYAQLLANRRRKVQPGDGLELHVVVCDELAHYLLAGDRKVCGEFAEVLRDLVSRGRAAGVIVLAATQKPGSDVVPTGVRDLFGYRWAMRCATWQASDTVLGAGWASLGYSSATVDPAQRGVGLLLHEGGIPTRLRSFLLGDDELAELAERAERLRRCEPRLEEDHP